MRTNLVKASTTVFALSLFGMATSVFSGSHDDQGKHMVLLKGHEKQILTLAFSPSGLVLASGGMDNTVILWDVPAAKVLAKLPGHTDAIRTVAFSPNGKMLASGGDDHTIIIWNVSDYSKRIVLRGHRELVSSVCYSLMAA